MPVEFITSARAILMLVFALTAGRLWAQETGRIPYSMVADSMEFLNSVKASDKLIFKAQVLTNASTKQPVQLQIESKQGKIPLKLNGAGEFVDFPLTKALKKEDPDIASNQPKGTLNLRVTFGIKYSGNLKENVAWYRDALEQVNAAVRKQAGMLSLFAPRVKIILFQFSGGTNSTVILKSGASEKSLRADRHGFVHVNLDMDGRSKDAQFVLPQVPDSIGLDVGEILK